MIIIKEGIFGNLDLIQIADERYVLSQGGNAVVVLPRVGWIRKPVLMEEDPEDVEFDALFSRYLDAKSKFRKVIISVFDMDSRIVKDCLDLGYNPSEEPMSTFIYNNIADAIHGAVK